MQLKLAGTIFDLLWQHRPGDWSSDVYRVLDELRRRTKPSGFGAQHTAACPPHVAQILADDLDRIATDHCHGPHRARCLKAADAIRRNLTKANR